jgi:hypothetical protein
MSVDRDTVISPRRDVNVLGEADVVLCESGGRACAFLRIDG